MEKFGIFELLDALAAITGAPSEQEDPAPAPQEREEKKETSSSALGDFLARHDRAADRIKK